MGDANTHIRYDGDIDEAERELHKKEVELLKRFTTPTVAGKKAAQALIKSWAEYSGMRSGYNTSPSKGLARRHVLALSRWTTGSLDYEGLEKALLPDTEEEHFYFAVGGHGRLMNDPENIIKKALAQKFNRVPHSFNIRIKKNGDLELKALTCKDCPVAGYCGMSDRCNGYVESEYSKAEKRRAADKKEYDSLIRDLK
jgi:hypothetical protein